MTRIEITLGLLTTAATVLLIALYGLREEPRMETYARGYDVRSVERGAEMYDQFCSDCHGNNAVGGKCPPLNQFSGLHGGSLGEGVAWRMEELGLDRTATYAYVYSTIDTGRTVSSRPWRWAGNRVPPDNLSTMAMPAWGEENGGPLRPDQIRDLTNYIVAFEDYLPEDHDDALATVTDWVSDPDVETVSVYDDPGVTQRPSGDDPIALGAFLFNDLTCNACHALEGYSQADVGPSFNELADNAAARIESDTYTGDADTVEAYIRESILDPGVFVVDGYAAGLMPSSFATLPDADLDALISFLLNPEADITDAGTTDAADGGAGASVEDDAGEPLPEDEEGLSGEAGQPPADEVLEDEAELEDADSDVEIIEGDEGDGDTDEGDGDTGGDGDPGAGEDDDAGDDDGSGAESP